MSRNIWLLLALALATRLLLALITPVHDEPGIIPYFNDERAHLNYVRYLAERRQLPVQTSSVQDGFARGEYEYYQAPLYYLLSHPFYTLGKRLTPGLEFLWVRLISILFSMSGLVVLYFAARRFFESDDIAAKVLLLGALSGIPLRFGALITNDSLLFAIACLYFALIMQISLRACDRRFLLAGVLVAAAGLWTKASFLMLLPLLPWVLLRYPNRSIWKAIVGLILPLLAILPWYLRNHSLYGRIIPLQVGFGSPDLLSMETAASRIWMTANYFVRSLVFPYDQLWGGTLDILIYPLEGLAFLLIVILGFISLRKLNRKVFWIFLTALAMNICSYLLFNVQYFQAEARLLIPALPFILILLAFGANRLAGEKKNRAYILLGLWMVLPWLSALLRF